MDVSCSNCKRTVRAVGDVQVLAVQLTGRGRPVLCQACVRSLALSVEPADLTGTQRVVYRERVFLRPTGCNVFVGQVAREAGGLAPRPASRPAVLPFRPEGDPGAGARKRVLVIDDDPDVLSVVAEALGSKGYEVGQAAGAEKAMRLLADGAFDLVVLDAVLPEHTGFIVLERLRWLDLHRGKQTPVIMITGHQHREYRSLAERLNVIAFLTKPFPLESLLVRTEEVLCA